MIHLAALVHHHYSTSSHAGSSFATVARSIWLAIGIAHALSWARHGGAGYLVVGALVAGVLWLIFGRRRRRYYG